MGSVINFTPLYGVYSEDPLCYLLEIDEICILLDCGWTDEFDLEMVEPLKRVLPRIDLVLLSHSDVAHLGALPYIVGKLGLEAPVYATLPVYKMGHLTMYDAYQSRAAYSTFDAFSLDDVDLAFDAVRQLKYSEKLTLTSRGEGIVITPHIAGHRIGGAFWRIAKETEEIIYAVDFNHRNEHHLSKTVLESFTRPALLITDCYSAFQHQLKRKARDTTLFEQVLATLRVGGNVLIPSDAGGRSLEILLVLSEHWQLHRLSDPLVFLHHTSSTAIHVAAGMLEWCSDTISKQFDNTRHNPFEFRNVKLLHSLDDLDRLPSPKVVVATSASLSCGFSRELFCRWASDPKNLIVLPERSDPHSLARALQMPQRPQRILLKISRKVPLSGVELMAHEAKEEMKRQEEAEVKAAEEEEAALEQLFAGMEDSDDEEEGGQAQLIGTFRVGLGKFTTPRFPLFSARELRWHWDEYGERINPEDFMDDLTRQTYEKTQRELQKRHKRSSDGAESKLQRRLSAVKIESEGDGHDKDRVNIEEAGEEDGVSKVPMKVVERDEEVQIRCKILPLDFEGLYDGRALRNTLSNIKPRKLILVHGSEAATKDMTTFASKRLENCEKVFAPQKGECIDIESDTSVYKLIIKDSLYKKAVFKKVGNYEVTYIKAEISFPATSPLPLLRALSKRFRKRPIDQISSTEKRLRLEAEKHRSRALEERVAEAAKSSGGAVEEGGGELRASGGEEGAGEPQQQQQQHLSNAVGSNKTRGDDDASAQVSAEEPKGGLGEKNKQGESQNPTLDEPNKAKEATARPEQFATNVAKAGQKRAKQEDEKETEVEGEGGERNEGKEGKEEVKRGEKENEEEEDEEEEEDLETEELKKRHKAVMVREGDLKLSLLKDKILKAGFEAEFKGGILVCKAGLALRKSSDDQVIIEGPISEAYFRLRAVLYSEYSFV